MSNPPFFIVGSGRSGTTMLRRMLNRHSQVCVPGETHFFPLAYRRFARLLRHEKFDRAVEYLNQQPVIRRWGLEIETHELEGEGPKAVYAHALSLVMARKAKANGKKRWGEKSPEYIHHIPFLVELFPRAKFIHIYRDGRDVALSVMPLKWGPNNAYAAARWYRKAIRDWYCSKPGLGSRALEVCYQGFVQDPSIQFDRICQFLDLPYEEDILDESEIQADRFDRWRNAFYMTKKEVEIFEYVAGDVLESLGYSLAFQNPSPSPFLLVFSWLDEAYKRISNRLLRQDPA